jgi:hypothetical protein
LHKKNQLSAISRQLPFNPQANRVTNDEALPKLQPQSGERIQPTAQAVGANEVVRNQALGRKKNDPEI